MRTVLFSLLVALPVGALAADPPCHHAAPAAAPAAPSESLYQLAMKLTDQTGRAVSLDMYRGRPVLISMFYSTCPSACPLLLSQLAAIDKQLSAAQRADARVLLVSVDPERDTPAALTELAKKHALDLSRWTLARAEPADVLKLAAALGIKYRKLPDGNYNHSSVITVLDRVGLIRARQEGSSQPAAPIVEAVSAVTSGAGGS